MLYNEERFEIYGISPSFSCLLDSKCLMVGPSGLAKPDVRMPKNSSIKSSLVATEYNLKTNVPNKWHIL